MRYTSLIYVAFVIITAAILMTDLSTWWIILMAVPVAALAIVDLRRITRR